MGERRHRYSHRVSERRRSGFPRLGHCGTWLIDELQLHNHNAHLHPGWSNTAEFQDTDERFGTVPLQSPRRGHENNQLPMAATFIFTAGQHY